MNEWIYYALYAKRHITKIINSIIDNDRHKQVEQLTVEYKNLTTNNNMIVLMYKVCFF